MPLRQFAPSENLLFKRWQPRALFQKARLCLARVFLERGVS